MTKVYPSNLKKVFILAIFLGLNNCLLAQTYTIPTVVHLITSNSEPVMLTDAEVRAGIENLNKQFSGEYANSILNTIIPQHQSFINNANIKFELATIDPNGNSTNGITRDNNNTWSTSAVNNQISLKSALKWDRSKYFNIYVVERLNSWNQSGLAYRPSEVNDAQDAVKDGALVTFRIWPVSFPFSGDQWSGFEGTMAHEVGHYFNLVHTWGSSNSPISCTDPDCTDFVADTPKHSETLDGYQANQQVTGCDGTVAMTDNFMTYSRHQCLFTPGQTTRMHNALNSSLSDRNNLWTAANLQVTGVGSGSPPPPTTYCSATGRAGTDTDYIINVSLGNIDHNSAQSDYSDFTSISTDLVKGNAYTINVEIDTEWGQDQAYVWVDWNEDQIFDNNTELINMSPYDNNVTLASGTLTVPSNSPLGAFRMRVRNIYASPNNPEPCGDIYGEVEDYTLNIVESSSYCSATGREGTGTDYITNVNIGSIDHNSGQSDYSDFTSISTDLVKGNAYTISVEIDTEWGQDQAYVWVDWNDNQIFDNNTELFGMSPYGDNITLAYGTLTVPSNTPLGTYRMRVRNIYASPNNPEPCGDIYGEVEDYTINVIADVGTCLENQVSLELQLDDYPEESSWKITDANGIIVAAGGSYNGQEGGLILDNICLPDGCYDFTIDDAYGDGICCSYGNGSYTLTDNSGQVLASGGQFNTSETTNFCLGSGSNCTPQIVDSQTFESGWGIWNDGGLHARRNNNDAAFANSGTFCVRLRNRTDESVITTDNLDLSGFSELTIDFSYQVESFENTEDFWLQISTDGGVTFTLVEDWIHTVDFQNNQQQNPSVTIDGPFSSNTQIRFRCDASGNGDKLYLDDIVISSCGTSGNRLISSEDETPLTIELAPLETRAIQAENFIVYPNPVSMELNIQYQSIEAGRTTIELYNLSGQKVLSQAVDALEGRNVFQLEVQELSAGMYFLKIQGASSSLMKPIVISR